MTLLYKGNRAAYRAGLIKRHYWWSIISTILCTVKNVVYAARRNDTNAAIKRLKHLIQLFMQT